MPSLPASPAAETTEQRVLRLLKSWREQTAYLSSSTQMTKNPAYQELITLGNAALPSLFRDLEQTKDGHLAKVLSAITGARPVPDEDRGQIAKVAEAWLTWARENGYRW
jgi:hypothetical protein